MGASNVPQFPWKVDLESSFFLGEPPPGLAESGEGGGPGGSPKAVDRSRAHLNEVGAASLHTSPGRSFAATTGLDSLLGGDNDETSSITEDTLYTGINEDQSSHMDPSDQEEAAAVGGVGGVALQYGGGSGGGGGGGGSDATNEQSVVVSMESPETIWADLLGQVTELAAARNNHTVEAQCGVCRTLQENLQQLVTRMHDPPVEGAGGPGGTNYGEEEEEGGEEGGDDEGKAGGGRPSEWLTTEAYFRVMEETAAAAGGASSSPPAGSDTTGMGGAAAMARGKGLTSLCDAIGAMLVSGARALGGDGATGGVALEIMESALAALWMFFELLQNAPPLAATPSATTATTATATTTATTTLSAFTPDSHCVAFCSESPPLYSLLVRVARAKALVRGHAETQRLRRLESQDSDAISLDDSDGEDDGRRGAGGAEGAGGAGEHDDEWEGQMNGLLEEVATKATWTFVVHGAPGGVLGTLLRLASMSSPRLPPSLATLSSSRRSNSTPNYTALARAVFDGIEMTMWGGAGEEESPPELSSLFPSSWTTQLIEALCRMYASQRDVLVELCDRVCTGCEEMWGFRVGGGVVVVMVELWWWRWRCW